MYEDRGERRDFQVRKSNKIYVSNLSSSISEDELRRVFGTFGPIQDVSLKHKETISFAFIEFSSIAEAEAAMSDMNGKSIGGQEIKVQFARGGNDRRGSFGDRGRGRPYGDRGGYQGRSDYGDRPRQSFGDRPRGCFNCGEEGHMIKDCPKPRKPREFNNNSSGGYDRSRNYGEGSSDRYDNRDDRGGFQRSYGDNGGRSYEGRGSGGYNRGGDYKRNERKHSSDRSRSRSPKGRSSPKGRRNRSPSSSRSR